MSENSKTAAGVAGAGAVGAIGYAAAGVMVATAVPLAVAGVVYGLFEFFDD